MVQLLNWGKASGNKYTSATVSIRMYKRFGVQCNEKQDISISSNFDVSAERRKRNVRGVQHNMRVDFAVLTAAVL